MLTKCVLRDRLGRSRQCGTVQLDGVLPQRLDRGKDYTFPIRR
jgi:threonyl-tRNA synthetase